MKFRKNLSKPNLPFKRNLLNVYIVTCIFIVFVYILTENTSISIYELVADPNEVGKVAPYTGFVSTIGILIFCATASICLFSACFAEYVSTGSKEWSFFLKCSGCFIVLLLIDDLWQIHENFPTLLFGATADVGLADKSLQNLLETIVFGLYGLLFATYLLRFRKILRQTEFLPLILSCGFFGLSAIVDLLLEDINGHFILEEGFKLLGIVSLSYYYIKTCFEQVKGRPDLPYKVESRSRG